MPAQHAVSTIHERFGEAAMFIRSLDFGQAKTQRPRAGGRPGVEGVANTVAGERELVDRGNDVVQLTA